MRFEKRVPNDPPDDKFDDLVEAANHGGVEAYELTAWPGLRFLDGVSFRQRGTDVAQVEHVSLGHGRRWSEDGWVAITTWQATSNRVALPPADRRISLANEYASQVRDWEIRGFIGLTRPDPSFRESFEAAGFEYLGQFGSMTSLSRTTESGALIGVAAVGEMIAQKLEITVCKDFAPYVTAVRLDMERRLRTQ